MVLNKKGPPDTDKFENMARLELALENEEKKVCEGMLLLLLVA